MKNFILSLALSCVVASAVSASPQWDAKLSVAVDRERQVTTVIDISNTGKRPICFRAHENWVFLRGADGKPLGEIFNLESYPADYVNVVWPGASDTFNLPINGGHPNDRGNVLTPDEVKRLVKADTKLESYDCIDYFANRAEPKQRTERELSATPEIAH